LEGPSGAIDVPDGVTAEEAKIGEIARQETERHLNRRRVLTIDELAELKDARPRLEKEFAFPGNSRKRSKVFMFSIDGTLKGERLTGCLFAGECMVVQGETFEKAHNLAKEGLQETIGLAFEYWAEDQGRLVYADPMDAIKVDVGGRRAAADPQRPDLESDPKLKAMIENIIGRKPWKH
jgi:hypothetical protein